MIAEKPWVPELVIRLLLGVFLTVAVGGLFAQLVLPPDPATWTDRTRYQQFLIAAISFQVSAMVWLAAFLRWHQVKWSELLGLNRRDWARAAALGLVWGLAIVLLVAFLAQVSVVLLSLFRVAPQQQATVEMLEKAAGWDERAVFAVVAIGLAPLVEEVLFRGILYPLVKQLGYPRLALWGTSLLFSVIHFNLIAFIPFVVLAIVLVRLYEKTDHLLVPIIAHAVFNAVNFALKVFESDLTRFLQSWR